MNKFSQINFQQGSPDHWCMIAFLLITISMIRMFQETVSLANSALIPPPGRHGLHQTRTVALLPF